MATRATGRPVPVVRQRVSRTRLTCHACGSSLEGDFELCKFCRSTPSNGSLSRCS